MKKIIVFTNPDKWGSLPYDPMPFGDFVSRNIKNDAYLSIDLKTVNIQKAESINDKKFSLFLVYDEIKQQKLDKFLKDYNGQLYFLYHSNSKQFNLALPEGQNGQKNIQKEGSHTNTVGEGYKELADLLARGETDVEIFVKAIFGVDNKLNITLEFLHKCLLNTVTDKDKKELREGLSLSEEEMAKLNNPKDNLSEIRDMLLGKIFN